MKLIPFNREHLNILEAREYERVKLIPFIGEQFLSAAERLPHCYSMIKDGRIITCFGAILLWEGVFEVWQIPSVFVRENAKEYARTLTGMLDRAVELTGARRLQTYSPSDALHDRWMEFIGFEYEGTLKAYSRFGDDFKMWARRYPYGR
jgi:hypothetical protein